MIAFAAFIALWISSVSGAAPAKEVFSCALSNQDWGASYHLNSDGSGILNLKRVGQKSYACHIRLVRAFDGRTAVVPDLTLELNVESCNFELNELYPEIFHRQTVILPLQKNQATYGRVQWLDNRQPEPCDVKVIDLQVLQEKAKPRMIRPNSANG